MRSACSIAMACLLTLSCAKRAQHVAASNEHFNQVPDLDATWELPELPAMKTPRAPGLATEMGLVGVVVAPSEPGHICRLFVDLSWQCVDGARPVADHYAIARQLGSRPDAVWSSRAAAAGGHCVWRGPTGLT